jgi:hypothetical protein
MKFERFFELNLSVLAKFQPFCLVRELNLSLCTKIEKNKYSSLLTTRERLITSTPAPSVAVSVDILRVAKFLRPILFFIDKTA